MSFSPFARVSRIFSGVFVGCLSLTLASAVVGCSSSSGDGESTSASSSKVTLTGNVGGNGGGRSSITTRTFGNLSTSGALHVSARELHVRGASGRKVDVAVGPDGSFHVDVARGARWVVTVDDAAGKSAIVTFGNGDSAISVRSGEGNATVDVGSIHVVGGQAKTDVLIDGKFGLEATIAELDEVFEAADGAIVRAEEAVADAKKAADEALKAAADAEAAAADAQKAAEAAAAAAEAASSAH